MNTGNSSIQPRIEPLAAFVELSVVTVSLPWVPGAFGTLGHSRQSRQVPAPKQPKPSVKLSWQYNRMDHMVMCSEQRKPPTHEAVVGWGHAISPETGLVSEQRLDTPDMKRQA